MQIVLTKNPENITNGARMLADTTVNKHEKSGKSVKNTKFLENTNDKPWLLLLVVVSEFSFTIV